ncbi:MAG: ASPIC/UnbV domain-containing protein [Candidatus Latescibacterota bacterium]
MTNLASSSPTRLYHNSGDGTFRDAALASGIDAADAGNVAWADYDRDGFLDLLMTVVHVVDYGIVEAPNRLYHNEGNTNHWLVLRLRGTTSNRDAVGARVVAVSGAHRQRRDVETAGSGRGSQPSLEVEFGFGSASVVDSLLIRWPSGRVQTLTDVATDQYLVLEESTGPQPTAVTEAGASASGTVALPTALTLSQNYPNPFNGGTVIRFTLPAAGPVHLAVYNLAGQRVATLVSGERSGGAHAVTWDGRDAAGCPVASGSYVYRLRVRGRQEEDHLAVVR